MPEDDTRTRKLPSTAWKPGQSGNLAGRPKVALSLAKLVRRGVDAGELIQIALAIARGQGVSIKDPHTKLPGGVQLIHGDIRPPSAREQLAAIKFLVERGYGVAPAAEDLKELDGDTMPDVDLSVLTDEELDQMERIAAKIAIKRTPDPQIRVGTVTKRVAVLDD